MKEGTNRYGYKALYAVFKELTRLDDKSIFDPQDAKELILKAKYEVLNLLTMVKEKRDRKLREEHLSTDNNNVCT